MNQNLAEQATTPPPYDESKSSLFPATITPTCNGALDLSKSIEETVKHACHFSLSRRGISTKFVTLVPN